MPAFIRLVLLVSLFSVPALAAEEEPLDEIVVTGEFKGPGLWRVTRPGDSTNHVLWIVGEPLGLPKGMRWRSGDIEAIASSAQEILNEPGVNMVSDEKIGVLRGLTLVPSLLKARKNPDDKELDEILPAELYARWLAQRKLFLNNTKRLEDWRPFFVAERLRTKAMEKLGLREGGVVWDAIGKIVAEKKVPVTTPMLKFTFKRAELRGKIKEFLREPLVDVECFRTTLDLTERHSDGEWVKARANAWARGDLETMRSLPPRPDPNLPCAMAVLDAQVARELIPSDLREQTEKLWLDAALAALGKNESTFAVLSFENLLRPDGYLSRLRGAGLEIEPPN
ncbi:MAG: TraB/GumN family protein [Steroidobacteraceae bacterium]|nr:TraB/GumN family protein [Steroidobacteraceae bacterium]